MSEAKRHLITQQVNRIMTSLHTHYLENSEEKIAERFGTIVLMLSNIFVSFFEIFIFKILPKPKSPRKSNFSRLPAMILCKITEKSIFSTFGIWTSWCSSCSTSTKLWRQKPGRLPRNGRCGMGLMLLIIIMMCFWVRQSLKNENK